MISDFNLPNSDWSLPVSTGGSSHDYFVQFCVERQLQEHVFEAKVLDVAAIHLTFSYVGYVRLLISIQYAYPLLSATQAKSTDHKQTDHEQMVLLQ